MKNFILLKNKANRTATNYFDCYTFVIDCDSLKVVSECETTFKGATFALEEYLNIEESIRNLEISFLEIERFVKYRKLREFHAF